MTDQLPLEVCRRIVEHLQPMYDNHALLALSLTSHTLARLTSPVLYHSLYLLGPRPIPLLLNTFTSRPLLASFPRQMYIHTSERPGRGGRTTQAYWAQVGEILLRVSAGVELLCIVASHDPDAGFASWVLRSLRDARRLSVLRVPFWWDNEVVGFLEGAGARGLTRLETADTAPMLAEMSGQQLPAPVTLHRDAMPNLSIVEAPPAALCLLVPGRPVTHVRVRLGPSTTLQTLPPALYLVGECLVRSAAPGGIIALDLGDLTHAHRGETYSLEVMELLPRFLPKLEFMARVNFPWIKDVPTSRLHKSLIRLHHLHVLELVISHMHPAVDGYWELATASELRTFSRSLREIVFWKGFDRHRWVWLEEEGDWVLVPQGDAYPAWGGV